MARMFCARCNRWFPAGVTRCPTDNVALLRARPIDSIRSKQSGQTGAILGDRYQIRGFLGKGAMARVYLAEDLTTHEPVAVKLLAGERAKDSTAVERFLREARAAQKVVHPGCVKTLDLGLRGDGTAFIVLEYLEGESLGDLLRRDGAVDARFALPMIRMAASALGAAHRAGVVHRDVKPDNLFLLGQRGDPHAMKVVDFGLAKLSEGSLTATGIAVGTLEYMAPEQIVTDPVDARTDVYAFGCVMYKMLTGKLPFDTHEEIKLVASHVLVPPPPPRSKRPDLDPRLETIILTALRKAPANRYPTMEELTHDLEEVLLDNPLTPRPLAKTPDKFAPRGPRGQNFMPVLERQLDALLRR